MLTIKDKFELKKRLISDINEHLDVLYEYATKCDVIAEFGVRWVCSSYAFAHAKPKKLICVDIKSNIYVEQFVDLCKSENINIRFDLADTTKYELDQNVDLLFIDTLHTFSQLTKELELHHSKVNKYLIFHDVITFGNTNEDDGSTGPNCGVIPVIRNFLKQNKNWKEVCTYTNNNGLTILEKIK